MSDKEQKNQVVLDKYHECIGVVGIDHCGKSSFVLYLNSGNFVEDYIGMDDRYEFHKLPVDDHTDVYGTLQEVQIPWGVKNMEQCKGYLMVFSVVNRQSFDELENNRKLLFEFAETHELDITQRPFLLVGLMSDLADQRVVTKEEAEELAKKWDVKYYEGLFQFALMLLVVSFSLKFLVL